MDLPAKHSTLCIHPLESPKTLPIFKTGTRKKFVLSSYIVVSAHMKFGCVDGSSLVLLHLLPDAEKIFTDALPDGMGLEKSVYNGGVSLVMDHLIGQDHDSL